MAWIIGGNRALLAEVTASSLCRRVASFCSEQSLFSGVRHVVAALSGGADSVALLVVLAALRERFGFELTAHHVRHGLRESDGEDMRVALEVSFAFGIPCELTSLGLRIDGNVEGEARRGRYGALLGKIHALGDGACLATAHHGDDNLETLLWRLGRGCGSEGLVMAPRREVEGVAVIRPFLGASKASIGAFMHEFGLPWREDPTNASDAHRRNRLRHHVAPLVLAEAHAAQKVYDSLLNVRRDVEALASLVDRFVSPGILWGGWFCRWQDWAALVRESRLQVLRHVARHMVPGHCPTQKLVEEAESMCAARRQSWRETTDGTIHYGWCRGGVMAWGNGAQTVPVPQPLGLDLPSFGVDVWGKFTVSVWRCILVDVPPNDPRQCAFSAAFVEGELCVRAASAIAFCESEDGRRRQTRQCLIDQGVPRIWHDYWPILCDAAGPLWIFGGMRCARAPVAQSGEMAVAVSIF